MAYLTRVLVVSLVAVLLAPAGASAKQGRGQGHGNARGAANKNHDVAIDRDGERRIIRDYYDRTSSLPPGLAKRQSLPPGLAKQLRERGQLPPGLEKRLTPVPPPLTSRLPALPPYYSRYFAGDDLLVVDRRSNRLISLIPNIF